MGLQVAQDELPLALLGALGRHQDHPQPGAGDVVQAREVHEHPAGGVEEKVMQGLFETGGGGAVEAAGEGDRLGDVAGEDVGLKTHGYSLQSRGPSRRGAPDEMPGAETGSAYWRRVLSRTIRLPLPS
ncbi:hypothetical protein SDC9_145115 [bioreactor metagenome]|uniref:Uncharacterized protein n=1 Tax=bioreactor metagenome TaxID=1076179 RepID=A0A645E8Y5_9ZZZZ